MQLLTTGVDMNGLFAMRDNELRAARMMAYAKGSLVTAERIERELASRAPVPVPMQVPNEMRISA